MPSRTDERSYELAFRVLLSLDGAVLARIHVDTYLLVVLPLALLFVAFRVDEHASAFSLVINVGANVGATVCPLVCALPVSLTVLEPSDVGAST